MDESRVCRHLYQICPQTKGRFKGQPYYVRSLTDVVSGVVHVIPAFVQVFGRRHDEPSTRSGGRRLKSAKARNRGRWGTVGAGGFMGI